MTLRDHTTAWKRLRKSVDGQVISAPHRSLRARIARAFARWSRRRDQAQQLRVDVAALRMKMTRLETALVDERRRRMQAESSLAAERYARLAFLATTQLPPSRRPRG